MVYTRNQPVSTDDLSVSQPILTANTNAADDSFGIDHFQFSDLTANNGFHKKATFPGTGLATPTPAANYGDMFATTTGGITQPYWIRDGLATIFNMLPIKAFGSFDGAGATINAINITAAPNGTGKYIITVSANVLDGTTNFGVLVSTAIANPAALASPRVATYNISSPTTIDIAFTQGPPIGFFNPNGFTVTILQA